MTRHPLAQQLIKKLHDEGRLRVWSIIITVLGDVGEPMGGKISIADLITICGHMDIEPQAVRTAMSRLSKEGWVKSTADANRRAIYVPTTASRHKFLDAAHQIYAPVNDAKNINWVYGILPKTSAKKRQSIIKALSAITPIWIDGMMAIWPKHMTAHLPKDIEDSLILFDEKPRLGASITLSIEPQPHAEFCQDLIKLINNLDKARGHISPEDGLVLRVLLVHFWRRLVLRYPHISAPLDQNIWPLSALHHRMALAYHDLVALSLAALPDGHDNSITDMRFKRQN